ncbi:hypothetical protein BH11PLA1_BH11PLA1_07330 [soil metagenome]
MLATLLLLSGLALTPAISPAAAPAPASAVPAPSSAPATPVMTAAPTTTAPTPAAGTSQIENVGAQGLPGVQPAATSAPILPTGQSTAAQPSLLGGMLLPMLAVAVVIMVLPSLMGRKDRKKRAELLSGIANHDKVQTSGGIIGTVAEVRDDEVVLRVDESSNTRIRFAKSAIVGVISKGRGGSGASSQTEAKPLATKALA